MTRDLGDHMTSNLRRSLLSTAAVLATAAGLTLGPTGTADAKTIYNTDARGDVAKFVGDSGGSLAAPNQRNGDIVRTKLWHATKVGITSHFADIRRTGDVRADILELATNEGVVREVALYAAPGHWAGETEITGPRGGKKRCAGITHEIDYAANTVTIRVPRSCLSNPRWVRIGFASLVGTERNQTATVDDALRDGGMPASDSAPKMSARLFRHQ
jgi:hypothetical protein